MNSDFSQGDLNVLRISAKLSCPLSLSYAVAAAETRSVSLDCARKGHAFTGLDSNRRFLRPGRRNPHKDPGVLAPDPEAFV